jgi:hypothetical protein
MWENSKNKLSMKNVREGKWDSEQFRKHSKYGEYRR